VSGAIGPRPYGSRRYATERRAEILRVLAVEPLRAMTVDDVWRKIRLTNTFSEIKTAMSALHSARQIETVYKSHTAGVTMYRLTREAESA
jgi:hypothetical protein